MRVSESESMSVSAFNETQRSATRNAQRATRNAQRSNAQRATVATHAQRERCVDEVVHELELNQPRLEERYRKGLSRHRVLRSGPIVGVAVMPGDPRVEVIDSSIVLEEEDPDGDGEHDERREEAVGEA